MEVEREARSKREAEAYTRNSKLRHKPYHVRVLKYKNRSRITLGREAETYNGRRAYKEHKEANDTLSTMMVASSNEGKRNRGKMRIA